MRRLAACALAIVVIAGIVGCADDGTKIGTADPPVRLALRTVEGQDSSYAAWVRDFADEVRRRSGGDLVIDVVWNTAWHAGTEDELAASVEAGTVEMAVLPARAWDARGIAGMTALMTPFLIDSDAASARVAQGDVADQLLADLAGIGIVGLALVPDGIRRPLSMGEPLLRPEDFVGVEIAVPHSPTAYALFEALLAIPQITDDFERRLLVGGLDAAESTMSTPAIDGRGIITADVGFYPKMNTLVIAQPVLEGLGDGMRATLRASAVAARDAAISTAVREDALGLELCSRGHIVVTASDADRSAFVRAADPVLARLEADPGVGPRIRAIRDSIAGMTVSPVTPCVPPVVERAVDTPAPNQPAEFPTGTYRVDVAAADLVAAGWPEDWAPYFSGIITLEVGTDTFRLTQPAATPAVCEGRASTFRDHLVLTFDEPCGGDTWGTIMIAKWRLTAGQLSFAAVPTLADFPGRIDSLLWPIFWNDRPWTRID